MSCISLSPPLLQSVRSRHEHGPVLPGFSSTCPSQVMSCCGRLVLLVIDGIDSFMTWHKGISMQQRAATLYKLLRRRGGETQVESGVALELVVGEQLPRLE